MKKENIFNVSKILLSLIQIPLWFIEFFRGVGHLPDPEKTDQIVEVRFSHSMFENINDMDCSILFYVSMGLVFLSVIFSCVILKHNTKKLTIVSNFISIVSIVSFVIILIVASTVSRGY